MSKNSIDSYYLRNRTLLLKIKSEFFFYFIHITLFTIRDSIDLFKKFMHVLKIKYFIKSENGQYNL